MSTSESGIRSRLDWAIAGALRFTVVSLLAFGFWASADRRTYRQIGEGGLYAGCLLIFILASVVWLRPLASPPFRSIGRFAARFGLVMLVYAIAWCAAWFILKGKLGEWCGSLAGSFVLGYGIVRLFGNGKNGLLVSLFVFALHSGGYFLGDLVFSATTRGAWATPLVQHLGKPLAGVVTKLLWGLWYGLGMGAGLGIAFREANEQQLLAEKNAQ